jgi:hypothetical protein
MNSRPAFPLLPVEIVLAPAWWHTHAGLDFSEDFFFHPRRRVEAEREMEQVLFERWGQFGQGKDRKRDVPLLGAVHLAAGFLISEMLGCEVEYRPDAPPQVHPRGQGCLTIDEEAAFLSPAFHRLETLAATLKANHGYVAGDVNWGGILNLALDLRGQEFFMDIADQSERVRPFLAQIERVIRRFAGFVESNTGSTSVSVNRTVLHRPGAVFLHSECTHTMISQEHYEEFLLPYDVAWSHSHQPFGIHYCGPDAHRFAASYAKVPRLDFLDVGWGGNLRVLREHLPQTFLNIRLSPAELVNQTPEEIRHKVRRLVADSGDPARTGICCINLDQRVSDPQVAAIFEAAAELRSEYEAGPQLNSAVPMKECL